MYASDIETYELVYLNQKALDAFDLEVLDEDQGTESMMYCYSAFPCGFCNNDKLCVGRFEEWRVTITPVGQKVLHSPERHANRRPGNEAEVSDRDRRRHYGRTLMQDQWVIQMYRNIESQANEGLKKAIAVGSPRTSINIILRTSGKGPQR